MQDRLRHSGEVAYRFRNSGQSWASKWMPLASVTMQTKRILYERGVYAFAIDNANHIYWSSNSEASWTTYSYTDSGKIESAYIFDNGNVFFTKLNQVFGSTDGCANISEIIPKDLLGNNYIVHVPANASFPGIYYQSWDYIPKTTVSGSEVAVWGNYGGNYLGAAPNNVYSCDNTLAITVRYQFGQNPTQRDDGTSSGGTTGTLLGDAGNSLVTDHVHSTAFDSANNTFYVECGDGYACIIKGVVGTPWVWSIVWQRPVNETRMWGCGMKIIDGVCYWGTEHFSASPKGIVRCNVADIANVSNHKMLFPTDWPTVPEAETYDLYLDSLDGIGMIVFNHQAFMTQNGFKAYQELIDTNINTKTWLHKIRKIGTNKFRINNAYAYVHAEDGSSMDIQFYLGAGGTKTTPVITATANGMTQIDLSWTGLGVSVIERSPDDSTWTEIIKLAKGTNTYSNTGLTQGTTYYYRVRTWNGLEYSSYSSSANATTAVPATSYANTGGSGNRTAIITASTTLTELGGGATSVLVNGVTSGVTDYWWDAVAVSGKYIRFDFGVGASKIINEAKFYEDPEGLNAKQGTWKFQGSNNGTSWTDIGSSFTLQNGTLTQLSGNTTGYRYYQLLGVSGNTTTSWYVYEFEFKICDA